MMAKFLDLLERSVIVQGVLTLLIVGAWLYMILTGTTPPDALNNLLGLVVGFYFGGKVATEAARLRAK